jgi:hypothetical protein
MGSFGEFLLVARKLYQEATTLLHHDFLSHSLFTTHTSLKDLTMLKPTIKIYRFTGHYDFGISVFKKPKAIYIDVFFFTIRLGLI